MEWLVLWLTLLVGAPEGLVTAHPVLSEPDVADSVTKTLASPVPDISGSEGGVDIPPKIK